MQGIRHDSSLFGSFGPHLTKWRSSAPYIWWELSTIITQGFLANEWLQFFEHRQVKALLTVTMGESRKMGDSSVLSNTASATQPLHSHSISLRVEARSYRVDALGVMIGRSTCKFERPKSNYMNRVSFRVACVVHASYHSTLGSRRSLCKQRIQTNPTQRTGKIHLDV